MAKEPTPTVIMCGEFVVEGLSSVTKAEAKFLGTENLNIPRKVVAVVVPWLITEDWDFSQQGVEIIAR